ncbi:MAG: hypothetical protein ACFB20_01900 [Opitutales bacterium]
MNKNKGEASRLSLYLPPFPLARRRGETNDKRRIKMSNTANTQSRPNTYKPSHPWYYLQGGKVLTPKEIRDRAKASGCMGWREEELEKLDAQPEPQRSQGLRKLRAIALKELKENLDGYRWAVLRLHRYRREEPDEERFVCDDVHVSVFLKYNHVFGDFAQLLAIDDMLAQQPDLFGGLLS